MGRLPSELEDQCALPELLELWAFDQIEPIGDRERFADVRAGIQTSWLVNMQIDPKKGKAVNATDIYPWLRDDKPRLKVSKRVRHVIETIRKDH